METRSIKIHCSLTCSYAKPLATVIKIKNICFCQYAKAIDEKPPRSYQCCNHFYQGPLLLTWVTFNPGLDK